MSEISLLILIVVFIILLIAIIHFYDRHLVKEINLYEERLEKRAFLKDTLLRRKKTKNKQINISYFLRVYGVIYKAF